ncbi:hypothetical protein ACWEKM_23850 [Streptomyces sp. NPDC004752]
MSSDTLAKVPAAPEPPEHPDTPRIVPRRRLGQRTAAVSVAVPVLLGPVAVAIIGPTLYMAAQALGLGPHDRERHYARGAEARR